MMPALVRLKSIAAVFALLARVGVGPAMAEEPLVNLIANGDFDKTGPDSWPENWTVHGSNAVLRPAFKVVKGTHGTREMQASGNGRGEVFGWVSHPVTLQSNKTYRMRVRFRFTGFDDVNKHLVHGVFAENFNNGIFTYRREGKWVIGENRFAGPDRAGSAEVRLYFRYAPKGRVWWSAVSLEECDPVPPRLVKIAVCHGNRDRAGWEQFLDAAGAKHCDIALMTEFFEDGIQTIDGSGARFIAEKARQWKMYVSGTLRLKRGDVIYNSALLLDRSGQLVGIYDKCMLYDPELDQGTSPGTAMPVFNTDFGKVGIMICYDSWFPETARLLAYRGAEIILLPNAGYCTQLMHARAADNGVVIAATSSNCPEGVWDSGGNRADGEGADATRYAPTSIVSSEKDEKLRMQVVTVDLSKKPSMHYWGGPMLSSPGGRRVRATGSVYLEDEIAREARRWCETQTGDASPKATKGTK